MGLKASQVLKKDLLHLMFLTEPVSLEDADKVVNECSQKMSEIKYLREYKIFEKALVMIEKTLKRLEGLPSPLGFMLEHNIETTILKLLVERVSILTDPQYQGSVSPSLLLPDLDRLHEISQGLDANALRSSRTDLMKRLRKALDLREKLEKRV